VIVGQFAGHQTIVEEGIIVDKTKDLIFKAKPFPPFIRKIIDAGGLVEYTKGK
jgi:3-isopropylmalate/(R)-2-methylmalate dehydratase small subunit